MRTPALRHEKCLAPRPSSTSASPDPHAGDTTLVRDRPLASAEPPGLPATRDCGTSAKCPLGTETEEQASSVDEHSPTPEPVESRSEPRCREHPRVGHLSPELQAVPSQPHIACESKPHRRPEPQRRRHTRRKGPTIRVCRLKSS